MRRQFADHNSDTLNHANINQNYIRMQCIFTFHKCMLMWMIMVTGNSVSLGVGGPAKIEHRRFIRKSLTKRIST